MTYAELRAAARAAFIYDGSELYRVWAGSEEVYIVSKDHDYDPDDEPSISAYVRSPCGTTLTDGGRTRNSWYQVPLSEVFPGHAGNTADDATLNAATPNTPNTPNTPSTPNIEHTMTTTAATTETPPPALVRFNPHNVAPEHVGAAYGWRLFTATEAEEFLRRSREERNGCSTPADLGYPDLEYTDSNRGLWTSGRGFRFAQEPLGRWTFRTMQPIPAGLPSTPAAWTSAAGTPAPIPDAEVALTRRLGATCITIAKANPRAEVVIGHIRAKLNDVPPEEALHSWEALRDWAASIMGRPAPLAASRYPRKCAGGDYDPARAVERWERAAENPGNPIHSGIFIAYEWDGAEWWAQRLNCDGMSRAHNNNYQSLADDLVANGQWVQVVTPPAPAAPRPTGFSLTIRASQTRTQTQREITNETGEEDWEFTDTEIREAFAVHGDPEDALEYLREQAELRAYDYPPDMEPSGHPTFENVDDEDDGTSDLEVSVEADDDALEALTNVARELGLIEDEEDEDDEDEEDEDDEDDEDDAGYNYDNIVLAVREGSDTWRDIGGHENVQETQWDSDGVAWELMDDGSVRRDPWQPTQRGADESIADGAWVRQDPPTRPGTPAAAAMEPLCTAA